MKSVPWLEVKVQVVVHKVLWVLLVIGLVILSL